MVPFKHVRLHFICQVCELTSVCTAAMYAARQWKRSTYVPQSWNPVKSLYMMEIWPLHPLEGWPWILVLCFTARIRGNLPQTHILLGEIWVFFFASALFKNHKTRLLLNCNLWLLTERENTVPDWDFSLIICFSCWAEGKETYWYSVLREERTFQKSS